MSSIPSDLVGVDTPFLVSHTVREHPEHERAVSVREQLLEGRCLFALCPTVLDEFLHVVTDGKRFERPLSMTKALQIAQIWVQSQESRLLFDTEESQRQQLAWMREHRLGRKRINDTRIAAIYLHHGVRTLLTTNIRDYSLFRAFEIVNLDDLKN